MGKRSISYDRLESLSSSSDTEIRHLSQIVQNMKERLESLERTQTELLDQVNSLKKEKRNLGNIEKKDDQRSGRAKYSCTMCNAKFSKANLLQKHRKKVHKAAYNI